MNKADYGKSNDVNHQFYPQVDKFTISCFPQAGDLLVRIAR
ncbi:hypothetical protein [Lactiplantibacillus paraxiangfangensis]